LYGVEVLAAQVPPSDRTQVQEVGTLAAAQYSDTPAVPVPLAFAIQTDDTNVVFDGTPESTPGMAAFAAVAVNSAQLPPIGAPATVATVALTSAHGLVAAVPVLIVFDCKA
jgi:hypothetical protein